MTNKICVIGLGYVGLPLAHAFSSKYQVVGLDIYQTRIDELNKAYDRTLKFYHKLYLVHLFLFDIYQVLLLDTYY